jgi:hypothetical protein
MNNKAKRSGAEKTEDQLKRQVCVTKCDIQLYYNVQTVFEAATLEAQRNRHTMPLCMVQQQTLQFQQILQMKILLHPLLQQLS